MTSPKLSPSWTARGMKRADESTQARFVSLYAVARDSRGSERRAACDILSDFCESVGASDSRFRGWAKSPSPYIPFTPPTLDVAAGGSPFAAELARTQGAFDDACQASGARVDMSTARMAAALGL